MSVPSKRMVPDDRVEQAQDQARGGRFAAAGFADQAERFAACEGEGDAVDGLQMADGAGDEEAAPDGKYGGKDFRPRGAARSYAVPGRRLVSFPPILPKASASSGARQQAAA